MASEIMSDPTLMLERDMPKSSTGRETQGITINEGSLSNLLECITQMLQQISMVQIHPQELKKEDTQPTILPLGLPLEVVQEFQQCLLPCSMTHLSTRLSFINCDRLVEMVNQFPAQLFLQPVDGYFSRSAMHVAVLEGSRTLICALLEKLITLSGGNRSKLAEHDFVQKADHFGLSATHMAALIANKEIISCFVEIFGDGLVLFEDDLLYCQSPTSEYEKRNLLEKASPLLERLVPTSSDQETGQLSIREWLLESHVDFVYCLHEAALNISLSQNRALEFVEFVCDNGDSSFLEPLLNVRDSLGKSPLHMYNDKPSELRFHHFYPLFERLIAHFPNLDWNMPDYGGRTPLHWAAAQGYVDLVSFLASQEKTNLNATYKNFHCIYMKENTNFDNGEVDNVTPLHLAVIHNHIGVVEALLKVPEGRGLDVNVVCERWALQFQDEFSRAIYSCRWTPIQLAAYMGHEQILQLFLKDSRIYDPGLKNGKKSVPEEHNSISALHIAASQFHPSAVNAFVHCKRMDILVKDVYENTALHYAAMDAHGHSQVHAMLGDYVTVSHFASKPPKPRKPSDYDIITCIDILMQSGLDMEQKNKDGETPTLHPSCSENVLNWWLQKMAKETQEKKNNLISAANAISVTAALVATASFVGPLQPPLGLLNDGNQTWLDGYSEVQHTSVQVFLFCDSLSFYFAIAAIVFAMLPSWPIPHEGLTQEVRIARRCVQIAVLLLFGSIIFVIGAFSAASIAIVPDQRWQYMTNAVISTSLGVLICFLILFLSFMRLLTLISSKSKVAKKISNVATQIILWEHDTSSPNKEVTKSIV